MLEMLRKRRDEEEGFTLIELMVVVLIIAILIAIAIPTFLGARQRAQDRAVQSSLRNALAAEKTFYTDNQAYTQTVADMQAIEPSLTYAADAAVAAQNTVYLSSPAAGTVTLAARSASGTCFLPKAIAACAETMTSLEARASNSAGEPAFPGTSPSAQNAWSRRAPLPLRTAASSAAVAASLRSSESVLIPSRWTAALSSFAIAPSTSSTASARSKSRKET